MKDITTIGFDADDTLWHHERHYHFTQERFAELLSPFCEPEILSERLIAAERRNLGHYGYGVKGFTLSMIETAIEVSGGKAPASLIAEILEAGRDLLAHPIVCLPGVEETLAALKGDFRLIVITKGELLDQERKLAASGLDHHFEAVEIVSEKLADTYQRVFTRHGQGPDRSLMVGNSLKSDILPALEAGSWALHVPSDHKWVLDHAEEPVAHGRYRRISTVAEIPDLLKR
ncbi:MAG: HAD family hydrolase [Nitratireductor sp.]|nr:HAD family hydrolase [Nitratireductor sp.]